VRQKVVVVNLDPFFNSIFLKKLKSNLKILQCKAEQKRYMNIYMKH